MGGPRGLKGTFNTLRLVGRKLLSNIIIAVITILAAVIVFLAAVIVFLAGAVEPVKPVAPSGPLLGSP